MASLFLRFPEGKAKAFTMSYDDGVETDVRLIEIMRKNGLKGTFNLNSALYAPEGTVYPAGTVHRRMTRSQADAAYQGEDVEVAVHGLTHPFLEQLPLAQASYEVLKDRRNLEEQFGVAVPGMALPFGSEGKQITPALYQVLQSCGIAYSRTTVATHGFYLPKDWLHLDPTCHHDDPQLAALAERFLNDAPQKNCNQASWMFYLWGHSYEFDGNNNWEHIESFAAKIGGQPDVWYATNLEIADYCRCFDMLRFDLAMTVVTNPTAQDIWFDYNCQPFCVKAGSTLKFG